MRITTSLLLILTLSACAGQREFLDAGTRSAELVVSPAIPIMLRLPAGEIEIRGSADDRMTARVELACEDRDRGCLRRVEKIRFDTRSDETAALLALLPDSMFAWRDVQAQIFVTLPAAALLRADVGAGSVTVAGLENCVELDMYAGEATLRLDRNAVAAVTLDVGTGDASLTVDGRNIDGRRALLVGAELEWRGEGGGCTVVGDLQFGELTVVLQSSAGG